MRTGKIAALLLSGVMAASVLTGCGEIDKNAVVATLDGTEVSLGVANFAARLQQAGVDDFYVAYFGAEVWSSDLYGNGTTMADTTKESVMQSLFDIYTLKAHMADYSVDLSEDEKRVIADATSAFLNSNTEEALGALGADQATVEEYLTLMTIQKKMRSAIIADVDRDVSDEEANTGAYSYARVSKKTYKDAEGNSVEYTQEELGELAGTVEAFAASAKEGNFETAAEQYGYTVSSGTFTAADEKVDAAVLDALRGLEEGGLSGVIDTENDYYVVRLDAKTDTAATEQTRQTIISDRENARYDEVLAGWKEGHTWDVDTKVWGKVTFDNLFTTVVQSTEAVGAGTEQMEPTEQ